MRRSLVALIVLLAVGSCVLAFGETLAELKKKADAGDADAQVQLGNKLAIGGEVPRNLPEAVKLYRKAAVQGNIEAETRLGMMCEGGLGTARNPKEAMSWF